MEALSISSFFILGAIVGSFLNVVILRYNTGRSISGRSSCLSCGKKLFWYNLIPIISFLVQKGRCDNCKSAVAAQYPIVESVTAIIFSFIGFSLVSGPISAFSLLYALYEAIIFALLIVISAYDIRHKIIPDGLVYFFIGLSALSLFGFFNETRTFLFPHLFAGIGLAAFPTILWLVSRGRWMGLGDAKLLLGVGFILGPWLGISALVYAFWIGALFSLFLLSARGKEVTMKSEIPFGPFIVLGMAIAYFFNLNLFFLLL